VRRRIPVKDLRVGMYVAGLEESWLSTPFLLHRFLVKRDKQIWKLMEAGIRHLYIDTSKGRDMPVEAEEGYDEELFLKEEVRRPQPLSGEEVEKYVKQKENLLQIDRSTLLRGSFIDFGLFVKKGFEIRPLAEFNNRDIKVSDEVLRAEGELLIDKKDMEKYRDYLSALVKQTPDMSVHGIKNKVIKENTKILIKELLSEPRSGNTIKECKQAVEDIINAVHESGGLVTGLLTINKHDYYTYAHSVEVSVLSVGVAAALGFDDRDLFCIGVGSLLHDIGKSEIPPEILNKPDRLTDGEFSIMKGHVIKGKDLLEMHRDIPEGALHPVLEHHEKLSGRGYPDGLKDGGIHVYGKIVAIADVYDAITTNRAYRKALTPFQALSIIRDEKGSYDKEIFGAFVKMLGNLIEAPAGFRGKGSAFSKGKT
jgi:HD-GYP domain-containing protein (c-di-GMP phosphodiesterase class II)